MNSSKAAYNKIADAYYKDRISGKLFYNEFLEMPAMLSVIGNQNKKIVLDLGCGFGIYSKKLVKKGAKVYGIDVSEKSIEIARNTVQGADFKVGSVYNMPYKSNYFDTIIAALVVAHFDNWNKAFLEINRVLKKGGYFIFSMQNPIVSATRRVDKMSSNYRVFNNYFKQGPYLSHGFKKTYNVNVTHFQNTYETIIKTIVKNGFTIVDYVDVKPIKAGKKVSPSDYEFTSRVPYFCIFKVKKIR